MQLQKIAREGGGGGAWLQMTHNMKKDREQKAQAICKYDTVFLLSIIFAEMGMQN